MCGRIYNKKENIYEVFFTNGGSMYVTKELYNILEGSKIYLSKRKVFRNTGVWEYLVPIVIIEGKQYTTIKAYYKERMENLYV